MLNQIDIQNIIAIAKEAGEAIMQIYNQDFEVEYKQDNSPLTLADKNANKIIEDGLRKLLVSLPILSEESKEIHYEERRYWEYFWLVDPLDGTKEFVGRNGEFTVNIALICKDTPVLGVVYVPVSGTCYWAKKDDGAFKDGQRLPLITKDQRDTYKVVVSRSHMSKETQSFIKLIVTDKEKVLTPVGSSLKICMVAEGVADIYPRLGPTMEWDTAAAHAIINESSCTLSKFTDNPNNRHYYNKPSLLNSSFVVTCV